MASAVRYCQIVLIQQSSKRAVLHTEIMQLLVMTAFRQLSLMPSCFVWHGWTCLLHSSADTCTFQIPKWKSSKGNAPLPIWALSPGIDSHTLYTVLQQNPSSKLDSESHYSSQPMDQTQFFVTTANHTPSPKAPPQPSHLTPRFCWAACIDVCVLHTCLFL